ncbi:MAG: PAS domain-containing protein, partial [bacterium]|nr:PAS domain-containing protein [bacterium]
MITSDPHRIGVFAAMPIAATIIDADGTIIDVNDAFIKLARRFDISLRREDRVGRPLWEFAGENDPQLGRQAILDFLAGGDPEQWRRVEHDGRGRQGLHDMQLLALRDAEGQVIGALIVRQEVTEAVEQARQLEQSLQLLATFRTIGHLVLASLDLEVILETIAREIVKAGIFRSVTLSLVDEESHSVEVVRSFVHELSSEGEVVAGSALRASANVVGLRYDLDDPNIMAEVARTGELIVTTGDDPRFDTRVKIATERERVCYFIPVKRGPRVVAVLSTGSLPEMRATVEQRIQAMGPVLDQVAVAIEHARLYRETQRREHEARIGLAVQEVRTEILQMQREEDWSRVVRSLRLKLRAFLDYSACGINLVTGGRMHSFSSGHGVSDEVRDRELQ